MMDRNDYQREYQKNYQARTKRVNLVFSAAEYRSVKSAASSSGQAVASYVKRCALEAHSRKAPSSIPEEVLEQLEDLRRMVRIMGNNMNQMAKHSNRVKQVLDDTEPFVHLQNLEGELKATIAKVAKHAPQTQTGGKP